MRDSLRHRGPDEAGQFADASVSLGHRRLAILDLAHGQQPVYNEDRSLVLVYNGEIYNHPQLRPQLEQLGHRYGSNCDSETILHAYEAFGVHCLERFEGMFAFVLYDQQRRCLFGARDRLGKKPLYYTARPLGTGAEAIAFAFASEIKALRQHPVIARALELAPTALVSYLLNDYVAGRQSIYEHIARLEPGSAFVYGLPGSEAPGLRTWRYWDIAIGPSANRRTAAPPAEAEAGRRVVELLAEAVRKRLLADVPIGTFLSGGIDSSSIVALLTRFLPREQIKTFSIGFDEPSYDESAYAAAAARHFGTDHHCRQFTARDLLDRIPVLAAALDEPFADPSVLPVAMLSEFAREQVTVALGGDGGDELFAGYDPFRAVRPARWLRRLVPRWAQRRVLVPLAQQLPSSDRNMALDFRVARFLRGTAVEPARQAPVWMGAFSLEQLHRLLPDLRSELTVERAYAPMLAAAQQLAAHGGDDLDQALDFFERFYLPDDILVKVDRASMLHSLEVRCPYLDTALVEYVNSLPHGLKLRRGVTKYLLKQSLTSANGSPPLVPPAIVHRKKKGFGIPVARWIRGELRTSFRTVLIDEWPAALALFDRREIERLLTRHLEHTENHYKELWALFMLALWARYHLT